MSCLARKYDYVFFALVWFAEYILTAVCISPTNDSPKRILPKCFWRNEYFTKKIFLPKTILPKSYVSISWNLVSILPNKEMNYNIQAYKVNDMHNRVFHTSTMIDYHNLQWTEKLRIFKKVFSWSQSVTSYSYTINSRIQNIE